MKIAIDVHSIGAKAGGNETFYRQLLDGLSQDNSPNEYILLFTHPQAPTLVRLDERFRWVQVPQNPVRRICLSIPVMVRDLRPDVFHCQYILPPRISSKSVITIHDLAHERHPEFTPRLEGLRMRKLVPWSARHADHVVTVSEFSANDLMSLYGIPRSRITVAYQAPSPVFKPGDKSSAKVRLERAYGIRCPFILFVGRLQARKNLVRLSQAFARVRNEHSELKLVLVGKADLGYDELRARINELNLSESVIFPGYVPSDDLPLFYNAAEMFVFPSIFEGFGLPVMEAMASAVPTITSNGSCLAEVAGNGALLIDPMSVDSIAQAMTRVLNDAELRRELIERGLQRSAGFTTAHFAAKVLDVYKSVVG